MDRDTAQEAVRVLNEIIEYELAGVVRYTHYSLMITGPNRIPLVEFMKAQAAESLSHAQAAGEILTGLEGHPSLKVAHGVLVALLDGRNLENEIFAIPVRNGAHDPPVARLHCRKPSTPESIQGA